MNGSMTTPVFGSLPAAAAFWALASSWLVRAQSSPEAVLPTMRTLDPSGLVTMPVASSTVPLTGFFAVLFSPPLLAPLALLALPPSCLVPAAPCALSLAGALSGLPTVKCRTDSLLTC